MDRCKICKRLLNIAGGEQCSNCGTIHCPICGAASHIFVAARRTLCRHLIAMACLDECHEDAGGWERSPFVRWHIEVPKPPRNIDWTDISQVVEALDILVPLLNAYEEDGVDAVQLFDLLLEEVGTPVRRIHWHIQGLGIRLAGDSRGTDYFTADPDDVREQLAHLTGRLKAGFERITDVGRLR